MKEKRYGIVKEKKTEQNWNNVHFFRFDKTEKSIGIANGIFYVVAGWIVAILFCVFAAASGTSSSVIGYATMAVMIAPFLGFLLTLTKLGVNKNKYDIKKGILYYLISSVISELILFTILYGLSR